MYVFYSFIELLFSDQFPELRSRYFLNNFAELFWIVRAWDGLCELAGCPCLKSSQLKPKPQRILSLKVFQLLVIAEIVSNALELKVC